MRVEKIEVPASVREKMEKPLAYLFARADKGGAGWIGRLDAPKGETFGGIMFYAGHVLALKEIGATLHPICRWTCSCPHAWEDMIAYMPPATAYGTGAWAWIIPSCTARRDEFEHWWIVECRRVARRLREGMDTTPTYAEYRRTVECDKKDMLLRWRMGDNRPGWRLDWMVGAGMTPWDLMRRSAGDYPMEKDNPVGRRMMQRVAAERRRL